MATVTEPPSRYDRSLIDGPIVPAVWKLAWPTMLTNVVGGLQGMVDQALVGNLIGYKANAAIGVSSQIFLIVVIFIASLFSGMSVLVARFAGQGDHDRGNEQTHDVGTSHGILAVYTITARKIPGKHHPGSESDYLAQQGILDPPPAHARPRL